MVILLLLFAVSLAAANEGAAPVIKEQPDSVVARRNDPATLNCAATGATRITWFRDGEQVVTSSQDPRSHRVLLPSGSLFFLRVATGRRDTDAGTYWCVASNSYGVTRSLNATLLVASISYDFQQQPGPLVKTKIGDSVILPCRPPKGSPTPSIKWLRDGQEILNSSRLFVIPDGDLVINETVNEDSATYVCTAQNVAGSRESSPSGLVIMNPPWFQERPVSVTTASGVTIELTCIARGSPTPRVTWHRMNGKIPYERVKMEETKLTIEYVIAVDSGVYTCEATNEAGSTASNATLTVVDAPVLVERPEVVRVIAGEKTELSCRVEGNPNPLIMWRLPTQDKTALLIPSQSNDHATVSRDGQRLVIEKSATHDSGVYYCWGISSGGGVSAHAKVMVVAGYPPPVIGVGPQDVTVAPGGVASLPCEVVSEAATPTVSWLYRPTPHLPTQQLLEGSSYPRISITINGALILKDIQFDDAGIYTCNVKADTGNIEQEAVLQVDENAKDTTPVRLPAPPSKPQVTTINETAINLRWLPNSQVTVNSESWYSVEYWKHDWDRWMVAAAVVRQESCMITNLIPGEVYTFLIRAVTTRGASFPSPWSDPVISQSSGESILTPAQVHHARRRLSRPTVTLIDANITGPSSALLTWKFLTTYEVVEGVLVYTVAVDGIVKVATVLGSSSSSHHLHNLQPYTGYTFFVVPFWRSIEGTPSNSFTLFTPEDIPMVSPGEVHTTLQEDGSAIITWSSLTPREARGKIIGYQVTLTHNGSQRAEAVSHPLLEMRDLVLGRLYTVRVAAQTGAGLGPFSTPVLMDLGSESRQGDLDSPATIDDFSVLYAPPQPAWLIYLLVPIVLLLFAATLFYVRKLHQKAVPIPPHRPVLYQDPSIYPAHHSINMYSEQKLWRPNGYGNSTLSSVRLLPSDQQVNEYAEPRSHPIEDTTEPYATTSLLVPASPRGIHCGSRRHLREGSPSVQVNWTAFLPPPPSCPPPRDLDLGDPKCQNVPRSTPRIYTASSEYDNISTSAKYKRPCDATSEHNYYIYTQLPMRRCPNGSLTFHSDQYHSSIKSGRDGRPRRPSLPPYNNTQ